MRLSLPRLLARPPLTAPIPTAPYTTEALAGSGGAVASWVVAHVPVPPHAWEAKFGPHNFAALPALESNVVEEARRRHREFHSLGGASSPQYGDGSSAAVAAAATATDDLEPYLVVAWDGKGTTSSLNEELGKLRIDWQVPGRAPHRFQFDTAQESAAPVDLPPIASLPKASKDDPNEVYVCTHGKRDCRCADVGGALVDALNGELERQGLEKEVEVFDVSHLGGHKYAANALCFPSHTLLGNLRPSDAPLLARSVVSHPLSPTAAAPAELLPHWRGVTGHTKQAMLPLHAAAVEASQGVALPWEQVGSAGAAAPPADEEVPLVFRSWEGEEAEFDARIGETLMDLGKRLELGAIEGVCGGVLECATCHCYMPPDPTPAPVEEVSDAEEDMLWTAMEKTEDSRLGCQIYVTKELSEWCAKGGRIGLPRY